MSFSYSEFPGLKPTGVKTLTVTGVFGTTKQGTEKVEISGESDEEHPSAAKAGVDFIDLSARVNSCPFKTNLLTTFSAAHKFLPCYKARFVKHTLEIQPLDCRASGAQQLESSLRRASDYARLRVVDRDTCPLEGFSNGAVDVDLGLLVG